MEEFRDLRVFIHVNSDDYLERHYTGNCRLVQSRNSHFLSAAVDRASALGSAGARAHEEPDMRHQRVQVEALSVAVCGV